jgi:hypothetical protein
MSSSMNTIENSTGLVCECGRACKSKGGLSLHKRVCQKDPKAQEDQTAQKALKKEQKSEETTSLQYRMLEAQIRAIEADTLVKTRKAETEALIAERKDALARAEAERKDALARAEAERKDALARAEAERKDALARDEAERKDALASRKLAFDKEMNTRKLALEEEIKRRTMALEERQAEGVLKLSEKCANIYGDYLSERMEIVNCRPTLMTVGGTLLSSRELFVYGTPAEPWFSTNAVMQRLRSLRQIATVHARCKST